jgi:hypothetical protein
LEVVQSELAGVPSNAVDSELTTADKSSKLADKPSMGLQTVLKCYLKHVQVGVWSKKVESMFILQLYDSMGEHDELLLPYPSTLLSEHKQTAVKIALDVFLCKK